MCNKRESKLILLAIIFAMFATILFNNKVVMAASTTTVEFINVATNANTNGKYKGDATLIEYKGLYFLIDTGYGFNYGASNDPLTKRLNNLVSSGKYLSGIIITHSHDDHYGALSKILNTSVVKTGSVKNGGTTIYYNNTYVNGELSAAINKAKNKGITVQAVNKGSVCNAYTGNTNTYSTARNNNGLYIYGAALALNSTTSYDVNQSSMIVQLKSDNVKAILLGDLQLDGLKAVNSKYGKNIFSVDYDVCKVGHHGLRTVNTSVAGVQSEVDNYYKVINAEHYIFTTYSSMANSAQYVARHSDLKAGLSQIGKTYYSSSNIPIFK